MPRRFAPLAVLVLFGLFPVIAQAAQTRTVTGAVEYPQGMALPAGADLHVAIEGRFGAVLGETRIRAGGQQAPLPFTLTVPSGLGGNLAAMIRLDGADGAPRWIVRDVAIAAGADPVDLGIVRVAPVTPLAFVTAIRCEEEDVAVGILGEEMVLRADGRDIALRQAISASGARYEAVDDPETEVWSKGDAFTIRLAGRELTGCRTLRPPERRPYRARGIEPGWHVDLGEEQVEVVADHGALRRAAARPAVGVLPGAYLFDMPGAGASLRIVAELCRDAATGMPYPDTAVLSLGERVLEGCGGDPRDLLLGAGWQVTRLGGERPERPEHVSLSFLAPARVAGSTGCNRFIGDFTLTGEGLAFGALGSTLMACSDALMAQERQMLDALENVRRFDLGADGALHLIGGPRDEVLIEVVR
ncbi:MAG: META domain-containing protein [Roseovarius sp.]|nr:META domain-containing protein [Roseovarius sp.]